MTTSPAITYNFSLPANDAEELINNYTDLYFQRKEAVIKYHELDQKKMKWYWGLSHSKSNSNKSLAHIAASFCIGTACGILYYYNAVDAQNAALDPQDTSRLTLASIVMGKVGMGLGWAGIQVLTTTCQFIGWAASGFKAPKNKAERKEHKSLKDKQAALESHMLMTKETLADYAENKPELFDNIIHQDMTRRSQFVVRDMSLDLENIIGKELTENLEIAYEKKYPHRKKEAIKKKSIDQTEKMKTVMVNTSDMLPGDHQILWMHPGEKRFYPSYAHIIFD